MAIFNLGSINWDYVFQVSHRVRPGETLASQGFTKLLGGKGANQSVAIARAGGAVAHIGAVKTEDTAIRHLANEGVDIDGIQSIEDDTGMAMIQVTPDGENAIVLNAGANHRIGMDWVTKHLSNAKAGDWLLAQNETSCVGEAVIWARQHRLRTAFNPAPMDAELTRELLPYLDVLFVNQVELMDLTNRTDIDAARERLLHLAPDITAVVTLGAEGALLWSPDEQLSGAGFTVTPVDTTGAGDTFIGYWMAAIDNGDKKHNAMTRAMAASAINVTRAGAMAAIPTQKEVEQFLRQHHDA